MCVCVCVWQGGGGGGDTMSLIPSFFFYSTMVIFCGNFYYAWGLLNFYNNKVENNKHSTSIVS